MLLFKHAKDLTHHLVALRTQGLKVGFVPTMGALHAGHISLIKAAKKQCAATVCSIFVNPTQFNDPTDFAKYPVTIENDIEKLTDARCDVLFLPDVAEMYPHTTQNEHPIDFGFLAETLEGEFRPGHFSGMAQIVEKLLTIVQPDRLFMGQKDYQQQLIVGELIKKKRFKTRLVVCPIVREKDGLAMSSRNVRLAPLARAEAVRLSQTLKAAKALLAKKNLSVSDIETLCFEKLKNAPGIFPEYFALRNASTLKPVKRKTEKIVALTAVQLGGVRLIDNMRLN